MGYWIGLLVPGLSYVVYPVVAIVLARFTPHDTDRVREQGWPSVTVAIAAHDEERTIERCVRAILAQAYPGPPLRILVGLDGCTDGTAAAVAGIRDPAVAALDFPRSGKATTDNRLVAAAEGDVVVTTSAGAEFPPGTLTLLVAPLRDPAVGCTSGVFRPRPAASGATTGEGAYWRMEYRLMRAESRLHILATASGTALAFRRALFAAIPPGSDADVTVAPTILAKGGRVVHVPAAIVLDDGPATLGVTLRSRRRMALRAFPATLACLPSLIGSGHVAAAVGLVLHKVFRWLTPVAAILWLACASILVAGGDAFYAVITAALAGALGLGVILIAAGGAERRHTMLSLAVAQVAFLLAIADVIRGRKAAAWDRETA